MPITQPPLLHRYFSRHKYEPIQETHVHRSFYLSWEDALWHLLTVYRIKKGAVILVPEYYCGNVMDHMAEHGLVVRTYPVDRHLTTQTRSLESLLRSVKPDILIIFHPVGIPNRLMDTAGTWVPLLPPHALLIEDCVHSVIKPSSLLFLRDRHFFMDSLRKVVPVQGSFIYAKTVLPKIGLFHAVATLPYRMGVAWHWAVMQLHLIMAYYSKHPSKRMAHNHRAELAMLTGYRLIGSKKYASPGLPIMHWLASHMAVEQIERNKSEQFVRYQTLVRPLLRSTSFWLPQIENKDHAKLRGFPLVIAMDQAAVFLRHMRASGIFLRFELDDSPWSTRQKIVYLPMGIHVRNRDIAFIGNVLMQFATNYI
jgi:hypothetical protein